MEIIDYEEQLDINSQDKNEFITSIKHKQQLEFKINVPLFFINYEMNKA